MNEQSSVFVDIDKQRIREVVSEALRMMREYLQEDFCRTDDQIMGDLETIIGSNKVSSWFFLNIGSKKIPDLVLRVDPIRKEVLGRSAFKKKVAQLNHFIKVL
jgi:hypothetical protein